MNKKLNKNLSQKEIPTKRLDFDMVKSENKDKTRFITNDLVKKTIKNIKELTKTGFDGEAQKENNQDNFFIYRNFGGNANSYYFGVWYNKNKLVMVMESKDIMFQAFSRLIFQQLLIKILKTILKKIKQ